MFECANGKRIWPLACMKDRVNQSTRLPANKYNQEIKKSRKPTTTKIK